MERIAGELAQQPLLEVIRSIYLERRSGVLEAELPDGAKRFFFVDGELHLPATHPLAGKLSAFLPPAGAAPEAAPRSAAVPDPELVALMARIAALIADWRQGSFVLHQNPEALPGSLIGPLPTAHLLMEGAVLDAGSDGDLLHRLGGEEASLVSRSDWGARARALSLGRPETNLLARLDRPLSLRQLLHEVDLDRRTALDRLCRLMAIDLVRPATPFAAPVENELVSDEVVRRFAERVGRELVSQPLELPVEEHRAKLASLLADLGDLDHYRLLGVTPNAKAEAIHAAYGELARVVHPGHADRLGLAGKEQAVQLLFERATEAYLTLSDPQRRERYDREMGLGASSAATSDPGQRGEEAQKLARQYFERARMLVASEDYHFAIELLAQATRSDPQAEYFALLGEIQAKNPNWLRKAVDSYRQAVQLRPADLALRMALARTCEAMGDRREARLQYTRALSLRPGLVEATAAIERLSAPAGVRKTQRRGLFSRLFEQRGR